MKRIFYATFIFASFIGCITEAYGSSGNLLITRMAHLGQISEKEAKDNLDLVFSSIREELKEGNTVTVRNFGKFFVANRDERIGRNPKTGESIKIPAKKYPRFNSSENLKKDLNPNVGKALALSGDDQINDIEE